MRTEWEYTVTKPRNLSLGYGVDIGAYCYINASQEVIIEDEVQIGPFTAILTVNTIDKVIGPIVIKRGAKIGAHSLILPNVTIGERAVCGAYSLIKEDVPAGAFVKGGNHKARIQGY